ncbi:hypothetical protein [Lihuaxuella thermophila]|uniref:Uncharacterized protein n=1 Tax=Lihuaxuella thermophila TaxID=1173111 RepID=A0A1H8B625_9BACL|nr:hypothetical protein [Lihuaxuella thermophila]SEM78206.1 hypothetical protein SAMN05444955_10218 [Lihuaxuella thermophila]
MDIASYLTHPYLWGGLGLVVIIIIALSIWISKRRAREVEELEKMFPENVISGEGLDISLEKVRRATKEREKRKNEQASQPKKTRPQKTEKALPNGDPDLNLKKEESDPPQQKDEPATKKERKKSLLESFLPKKPSSVDADEKKEAVVPPAAGEDRDKSIAVRKMTRKARSENKGEPTSEAEQVKKRESKTDAATSRQLYKRSLLNPDRFMNQDSSSPETSSNPSAGKQENDGEANDEKHDPTVTADTKKTTPANAAEQPEPLQTVAGQGDELPSRSKRWAKKKMFKR